MDSIAKSDAFFFITAIAVVCLSVALLIALVYCIRILRNISDISTRAKEEAAMIQSDIHHARAKAKTGSILAALFGLVRTFYKRNRGNHPK